MVFIFQVIFLIGNKCDLDAQRDVTYEEAKQFAEENGNDIYTFPFLDQKHFPYFFYSRTVLSVEVLHT